MLSIKSLKNPDVIVLGGAGFSKLFFIEVRKFTVSTKISRIHLFVVPMIQFYCLGIVFSEFAAIAT